jgi:RND family efflux transporter MFP subunit
MMKRSIIIAGLLLALVAGNGCGGDPEPPEELIRPVRYQAVYTTGGVRVRTFSGVAKAGTESQLSFKVAGNVTRVAVNVGDKVQQGDLVASLDDSDYRLQVQEAEASLAQTKAAEKNARSSYERTRALWENASASKQDLDGALATYESAAAQVQSIQKRLELARLQVNYTRLTAPFAGAVAAVRVEVNENVGTGQTVALLSSGDQPEVQVTVPGVLITQIETGSPVQVSLGAIKNETFTATVTEVGVTSTGFATTYPVTVRLETHDPRIRPGMAAEVSFRFENIGEQELLVVPSVAVGEDHHGRFVFVLEIVSDGLGIARRRSVRVGELTSDGLQILEGLQEGELVVTAGVSHISDGQQVKLL